MARRCQNCDKLWSKCSLALINTRIPHSRNLYKWKYFVTFHHNQLFSSTNSLLIVLNLENLQKMNFLTIFAIFAIALAQPSLSRGKRDLIGWNRQTNSLPHLNQAASRLPSKGNANLGAMMKHVGAFNDRAKAKLMLKAIQRLRRAKMLKKHGY